MNVHGDNPTTNLVLIHRNALKINIENCGKIEFFKKKITECPHTLYCIMTNSYIYRIMYLLYNSLRQRLNTLQIYTINAVLLGAVWK